MLKKEGKKAVYYSTDKIAVFASFARDEIMGRVKQ
jgi:hypothetical protein